MKRPPWIAIVLGVCAWAGVITLAVQEIWWPLWVIGGLTVAAAIGGLAMVLSLRRMAKLNPPGLVRETPVAKDGRAEPIAEPPKPTGRSGPRTNARTAGRRNKSTVTAIALGLLAAHAQACRRGEGEAQKAADAKAATPDAKSGDAKSGDAKTGEGKAGEGKAAPVAEDPALVAALDRAIQAPPTGEATYQIDPFVAVLVFERVRAGAEPTFTPLPKPIEGGPQAGFVIGAVAEGSLAYRLGLRTGDVVEAINGVVLTSADRIGFALDGAANRVELTIHRDDVSVVQSYRLTQALAWTELLASFTGDADPRVADAAALDGGAAGEDGRGDGAVPSEPTPEPEPTADDGGGTPSKLPTDGGGGTTPRPKPTPTPTPTPKPTPTPTPTPTGGPVACESSTKCTVTKAYFDSLVDNPSRLESQANIVPAIQNDVHSGYKLKSIKPGSSLAKLGFHSDDKITHINGYDLTDDFQAAQLYMGVSSTKVFKIRYERGGSKLVKTIVVK